MKIKDFSIERYFAEHEFTARYLLSSSDSDGYSMQYVIDQASPEERTRWDTLTLGYTETRGAAALRTAICKYYTSIGEKDVVVLSPNEAIFSLMNVLLQKGDHVICMSPIYQALHEPAESIGCTVSFWLPESEVNWYYDPSRLAELITPQTKLIVVNFPHNPTGHLPSSEDWNAIISIAREKNIVLFSDEMYRSLIHDPKDEIPAACDVYENAVSLSGMSKIFGLAGLRIGWLASKNAALLQEIEAFKDYLTICSSAPSEILATIALNNPDKFIDPNIKKILTNIELFKSFSVGSELFEFYRPKAGSTAFIKLKTAMPALQLANTIVKETGIMLLPSEMFHYGHHQVRIGFGRANLPEILAILEQFRLPS
jgi:aspartate/methionine/tyrosine aminotransferase